MLDLFSGSLTLMVSAVLLCVALPFVGSLIVDGLVIGFLRRRWTPLIIATLLTGAVALLGVILSTTGISMSASSDLQIPPADYGPSARILLPCATALAALALIPRLIGYLRGART